MSLHSGGSADARRVSQAALPGRAAAAAAGGRARAPASGPGAAGGGFELVNAARHSGSPLSLAAAAAVRPWPRRRTVTQPEARAGGRGGRGQHSLSGLGARAGPPGRTP
jgi:hypothetical protein